MPEPLTLTPASGARARFGARLILGLAPDALALLRSNGLFGRGWHLLSEVPLAAPATPEALLAELKTQLTPALLGKLPLSIIVDDRWARYFLVTPPKNLSHFDDCAAATRMRFQALYGEAVDEWQIEADFSADQPFLACALPKALLHGLQQLASEYKSPLLGLNPHFIASFNRWHRAIHSQAWFGLVHQDHLTLAAIEQGRLQAVRTSHLAHADWHDLPFVARHIEREALRLNLAAPTRLQLVGRLPGNWARHKEGALDLERLDGSGPWPGDSAALALAACGVKP